MHHGNHKGIGILAVLFLDTMEAEVWAPGVPSLYLMQPPSGAVRLSVMPANIIQASLYRFVLFCYVCFKFFHGFQNTANPFPDFIKFVQFCADERNSFSEVSHVRCGCGRRSACLSSRHCLEICVRVS